MLGVTMQSVLMLSVLMQSVIMLSVVILNVRWRLQVLSDHRLLLMWTVDKAKGYILLKSIFKEYYRGGKWDNTLLSVN